MYHRVSNRVAAEIGGVRDDVVVGEVGGDPRDHAACEDPQCGDAQPWRTPPQQRQHPEQEQQVADRVTVRHDVGEIEVSRSHGGPERDVPDERKAAHEDRAHVEQQPNSFRPRAAARGESEQADQGHHVKAQIARIRPGRIGQFVQHDLIDKLQRVAEQVEPERGRDQAPRPTGLAEILAPRHLPGAQCRRSVHWKVGQVADQGLVLVAAPAEDLPQPVDGEHAKRGGQRANPDQGHHAAAGVRQPPVGAAHLPGVAVGCRLRGRVLLPGPAPSPRGPLVLAQPVRERVRRHRAPEQEALSKVTAEGLELGPDGLGLDPLGDHLHPELVSEIDGGPDDGPEVRVACDRPHDGHIELELIDGPAAQALQ